MASTALVTLADAHPDMPVQHVVGRLSGWPPPPPPWAITDHDEVAAIAARVAWYSRRWWRRLGRRPAEPTHLTSWPAPVSSGVCSGVCSAEDVRRG